MTIAGDARTVVAAGGPSTNPIPAIRTTGGILRLNPAVSLLPTSGPPITGSATVERAPIPSVSVHGTTSGATFTVDAHAEPRSLTYVFFSWVVTPVAFPFGTLWISPDSPVLIGGTVPADGHLRFSTTVPVLPLGVAGVVQPLSLTTGGRLLFGVPTSVVVN